MECNGVVDMVINKGKPIMMIALYDCVGSC